MNELGENTWDSKDVDALPLSYACREASGRTLRNLSQVDCEVEEYPDDDGNDQQESILCGMRIVKRQISNLKSLESFMKALRKVVLFRIKVPEHTDLNRYFEIMNTRGEQLEQHETLKAELMSPKELSAAERNAFAAIWDACADMDGYVQMHFPKSEEQGEKRERLFGDNWGEYPSNDSTEIWNNVDWGDVDWGEDGLDVISIINASPNDFEIEKETDDPSTRFTSIIDFPHFLLHVLRALVKCKGTKDENDEALTSPSLDDRKLVSTFKNVRSIGWNNNYADFSREFIIFLLQCRFLFDKYFIKRESDDNGSNWSLQMLISSSENGKKKNGKKKASFKNTSFCHDGDKNPEHDKKAHKRILMLQACLRVSHTSPRSMHWITDLLAFLWKSKSRPDGAAFEEVCEELVRQDVRCELSSSTEDHHYVKGVGTPNIVFNYLDYLLWKRDDEGLEDRGIEASNFVFEYRNSVEHWDPQHPTNGDRWSSEEDLNSFGNLCLVSSSMNSRFSNMPPEAKRESYPKYINNASLKLRLMSEATTTTEEWRNEVDPGNGACHIHGEEMLNILKDACFREPEEGPEHVD